MFCKQCGTQIDDNALFCPSCGYNLVDGSQTTKEQGNDALTKKKDKFTNFTLVLSVISAFFPIGLILNVLMPGTLVTLLCVLGAIILIPAFVLSSIALIAAFVKRKKIHNIIFKKRIVSSCLSTALPIVVLLVFFLFQNPINYSQAMKAYEEKDYTRASELFVGLEDYKDSKKMASECNYLTAISLAEKKEWKAAREIFEKLADQNYKASKELYAYCHVWVQAEMKITSAENKLISQLKDPSSYQKMGADFSYTITDRSETALDLALTIHLKYSATNSFGGRVTDTYTNKATVVLSNMYGIDAQTLSEIMNNKTIRGVITKYEK